MKIGAILAAIAALSLVILVSCGDDKGANVDTGPQYSRTAPVDLIHALATALEEEAILIYDECLGDEYMFIFLAQDADSVGLPPEAPWWGKTEDVTSTSNMFEAAVVTRIQCILYIDAGPWEIEGGYRYRLDPGLRVTVERADQSCPTILSVQNSWLYAEVIQDPYDGDKWVVKSLEEALKEGLAAGSAPGAGRLTEASTFGSIKALFR